MLSEFEKEFFSHGTMICIDLAASDTNNVKESIFNLLGKLEEIGKNFIIFGQTEIVERIVQLNRIGFAAINEYKFYGITIPDKYQEQYQNKLIIKWEEK